MSRLSFIAGAALLAFAAAASAENAPSVEATLSANVGKTVTLRLEGGEEMTGTVAALSQVSVKLSALQGKEFYGAVVRIERIQAVIVREQAK